MNEQEAESLQVESQEEIDGELNMVYESLNSQNPFPVTHLLQKGYTS